MRFRKATKNLELVKVEQKTKLGGEEMMEVRKNRKGGDKDV